MRACPRAGAIKAFAREVCRNDLLNFGRLHFFFPDSRLTLDLSTDRTLKEVRALCSHMRTVCAGTACVRAHCACACTACVCVCGCQLGRAHMCARTHARTHAHTHICTRSGRHAYTKARTRLLARSAPCGCMYVCNCPCGRTRTHTSTWAVRACLGIVANRQSNARACTCMAVRAPSLTCKAVCLCAHVRVAVCVRACACACAHVRVCVRASDAALLVAAGDKCVVRRKRS